MGIHAQGGAPAPRAFPAPSREVGAPLRIVAPRVEPGPATGPAIVTLYPTHKPAADAVRALERAGMNPGRVSVVGWDFETAPAPWSGTPAPAEDRAWDRRAAFWADLWRLLPGSAMVHVPQVGPLLVAGPLVEALGVALDGGPPARAARALRTALSGLGAPPRRLAGYEAGVRAGGYLVIAEAGWDVPAVPARPAGVEGHGPADREPRLTSVPTSASLRPGSTPSSPARPRPPAAG